MLRENNVVFLQIEILFLISTYFVINKYYKNWIILNVQQLHKVHLHNRENSYMNRFAMTLCTTENCFWPSLL